MLVNQNMTLVTHALNEFTFMKISKQIMFKYFNMVQLMERNYLQGAGDIAIEDWALLI